MFPDFRAGPERAESYDFALTDEYLAAVGRTGAEIVDRLGESIEHTTTKRFGNVTTKKWEAGRARPSSRRL